MAALASLALVGVLLVGPAAAAATPEARALALLDRGIDAFRAGDYAAARRAFEGARQLAPAKANAYRWLGFTEVRLGDCAQALLDFETFLRAVPATDERVPEVIRQRDACRIAPRPSAARAPATASSTTAATTTRTATHRSIARRWWFWTVLGVAAAGAATGIALGVVYARPHESRLPSIVCDTSGCTLGAP